MTDDHAHDYPHTLSLRFDYDDEPRARIVADAVTVEEGRIDDDRSTAGVFRAGATLRVDVHARDVVALRAGLNTWIRLVETAERTLDAADRVVG